MLLVNLTRLIFKGILVIVVCGVLIEGYVNSFKKFPNVPAFTLPTGEALDAAPDASYSSTGWVSTVYFAEGDTTCGGDPYYTTGIPVATCLPQNDQDGGSYMVQLTQDSCDGAVAQLFTDLECASYSQTQSLVTDDSCYPVGGYSKYQVCTTSSQPFVTSESVIQMAYSSYTCTGILSYSAMSTDLCVPEEDGNGNQIGMSRLDCSSGSPELISYPTTDTDCSGASTGTEPYPTDCLEYTYNDQNSFQYSCSSSGGGGSSGGDSGLSPGVAAGVAIGVIAFVGIAAGIGYFIFFAKSTALAGQVVTSTTAAPMAAPASAL